MRLRICPANNGKWIVKEKGLFGWRVAIASYSGFGTYIPTYFSSYEKALSAAKQYAHDERQERAHKSKGCTEVEV